MRRARGAVCFPRTLGLLLGLAFACLAAKPVRAQQPAEKPGPPEWLGYREQLGDPPKKRDRAEAVQRSEVPEIARNGYVSVQVNVDEAGLNIVGDAANEPTLAVNPLDPNNIVVGWRQFDDIGSDFRQAGYGYSFGGGLSWTFGGVIEPGVFRSDPVIRADSDGTFFYASATIDASSDITTQVFRSTDGGATWGSAVEADGGDKHWIAVDRTGGVGADNVYVHGNWLLATDCRACEGGECVPIGQTCGDGRPVVLQCLPGECCLDFGVLGGGASRQRCCPVRSFSRSVDRGDSFEDQISLLPSDEPFPAAEIFWPMPFQGTAEVAADGTVFVSGNSLAQAFTPGPAEGSFCFSPDAKSEQVVFRSEFAKDPASRPVFSFSFADMGGDLPAGGAYPNPGGTLGDVVVKAASPNGRRSGDVYVLATLKPRGSENPVDPADVHFVRSTDFGETWSAPGRVNDDAVGNGAWQWFSNMSVAPNDRIDAIWNDTRNSIEDASLSELFYSYSYDGGRTWSANLAVSPQWNSRLGWPRQAKIGDYYDIESDAYGAGVAYAATFNGEQDVYFLRVFPDCNDDASSDVANIEGSLSSDVDGDRIPDECQGLVLVGDVAFRSGRIKAVAGGATPGGRVAFYVSDRAGSQKLEKCEGGVLGLSSARLFGTRRARAMAAGGHSSAVSLRTRLPGKSRPEPMLIQAVDESTCRVSNILELP